MKILLFSLAIAVGTGLAVTRAGAQNYPWCAYYSADAVGVNCGFVSFEQCLTTLRGIAGICMHNTQYTPYALRTRSARRTDAQPKSEVAPTIYPVLTKPPASAVATPSIANQIKKVKEMITTKLRNAASIKFQDIAPGKAIDSVCCTAEVKDALGETREIPFVVQKTEVDIINGSGDLRASRAIGKVCD
jgi:hypothetical protein